MTRTSRQAVWPEPVDRLYDQNQSTGCMTRTSRQAVWPEPVDRLYDRNSMVWFSVEKIYSSLLQRIQTRLRSYSAPYAIGIWGSYPLVLPLEAWSWTLNPTQLRSWDLVELYLHLPRPVTAYTGASLLFNKPRSPCTLHQCSGHKFLPYYCPLLYKQWILLAQLTLRSLTLYIYGAPTLDVSRSHTTTQHSR